ncbi:hypothetical protein [Streptomyces sp. V4I23]|uniref:hypothetical protein n=1 Tax=Streptomyces sp. V4I23 TaxID=3042282 RepID=UPI0027D8432A|nr:hypothetical protein [Streptomyces sp. V4I23]
MGAVSQIVVTDNGHGMTPDRARESFHRYGETWKAGKTYTEGATRVLHGRNGEGRLLRHRRGRTALDLPSSCPLGSEFGAPTGGRPRTLSSPEPGLLLPHAGPTLHDASEVGAGCVAPVDAPQSRASLPLASIPPGRGVRAGTC